MHRRHVLSDWEGEHRASGAAGPSPQLAKVPFVELADGRLQGVVSSGSDIERVYVSSITAGDHAYHCSTNNNRPCGGVRGASAIICARSSMRRSCNTALTASVATCASTSGEAPGRPRHRTDRSARSRPRAAPVFSRFLRHLAYLEMPATTAPLAELHWFPATGGCGCGGDTLANPDAVDGLAAALDVVTGFDTVLVAGLLRPGAAQVGALTALAHAMSGSPLAARVAEAVDKLVAGSAADDYLAALAGARSALLGAVHDALLDRVDEATGRSRAAWPQQAVAEPRANLRAASRSWLSDLAIAGWRGIDHDLVAGSAQAVQALLADVELSPSRRFSTASPGNWRLVPRCHDEPHTCASMGGSVVARRASGPAGSPSRPRPRPRRPPAAVRSRPARALDGRTGSGPRGVRAGRRHARPAHAGERVGAEARHDRRPGIWQLLRPHSGLLAALGEGRAVEIVEMPVTDGGDLLWRDDRARPVLPPTRSPRPGFSSPAPRAHPPAGPASGAHRRTRPGRGLCGRHPRRRRDVSQSAAPVRGRRRPAPRRRAADRRACRRVDRVHRADPVGRRPVHLAAARGGDHRRDDGRARGRLGRRRDRRGRCEGRSRGREAVVVLRERAGRLLRS